MSELLKAYRLTSSFDMGAYKSRWFSNNKRLGWLPWEQPESFIVIPPGSRPSITLLLTKTAIVDGVTVGWEYEDEMKILWVMVWDEYE